MLFRPVAIAVVILSLCGNVSGDEVEFFLTGAQGNGLLPGNIEPPTNSSGSGDMGLTGIVFDTDTNILSIDIEWGSENGYSDLTGEVTLLHLHGPTPSLPPDNFGEINPQIIVNLASSLNFDGSATGGSLIEEYFLSNTEEDWLLSGRTYINVHTEMFGTGEIRGYLLPTSMAIPEPAAATTLAVLLSLSLSRRRR